MQFKLSKEEKELINWFQKAKYPAVYKADQTDNILFIETVDFDVCSLLLAGKAITATRYKEIIEEYKKYLSQLDVKSFDEYALTHYCHTVKIMEMFKKYYDFGSNDNFAKKILPQSEK